MQSRMDRYNATSRDDENKISSKFEIKEGSSRQSRNRDLYENYGDTELDNFDVDSNVSVIGDNSRNINLDNLRDMLDRKYREPAPRKELVQEYEENQERMKLAETREYDLNQILEKARATKEVNYEEERLMKLHNTQYDILKNLDLYGTSSNDDDDDIDEVIVSEPKNESEKRLMDLIDTINDNEFRNTQELALDIFSDLTGDDDNTKVLGAMDLTREIESSRAAAREEGMNTTQILAQASKTIEEMEEEYDRTQGLQYDPEIGTATQTLSQVGTLDDIEDIGSTTEILMQAGDLINEIGNAPKKSIDESSTTEILAQAGDLINEIGNVPKKSIDESSTTEILAQAGKLIDDMELPMTKEMKEIGNTTAILSEAGKLIEDMELEEKLDKPVKKNKKHEIDDDFADIKEDSAIINFLLKVIIVIIVILFIAGGIYLADHFLNLELF